MSEHPPPDSEQDSHSTKGPRTYYFHSRSPGSGSSLFQSPYWFFDESHPFYLVHTPVPLDKDMLLQLKDPNTQVADQVIKYILTYFTCLALELKPSKHCAVVDPHFTGSILHDIDIREHHNATEKPVTTLRQYDGHILTGCRKNFDYLLIPLHHGRHHTLAIWTRATGRVTYYNPMQEESERCSPRPLFIAALKEIFAEIEASGERVSARAYLGGARRAEGSARVRGPRQNIFSTYFCQKSPKMSLSAPAPGQFSLKP